MKKHVATPLLLCLTATAFAQSGFKKNDIYLEAGGNGLFGSVNYERQLTALPGLGARIGIGFYSEYAFYLTIPFGINYLFRLNNERSLIDAGLGATLTRIDGKMFGKSANTNGKHFVNFIPSLGYRRHTANDMMWRVSVTPIVNKYTGVPWIGFSVGKRF